MYTHHHNIPATRAILVISGARSLTAQPLSLDLVVLSLPVPPCGPHNHLPFENENRYERTALSPYHI